jgi:hypothetical protein
MSFISNDGKHYIDFPNKLEEDQIEKLPTKRLLAYFKKFRSAYFRHDGVPDDIEEYYKFLKETLAKREHVG